MSSIEKKMIHKKPIIIANWKASTLTYKEAEKKIRDVYHYIGRDISKIQLTFAPTVTQTAMLSAMLSGKIVTSASIKTVSKNKKKSKDVKKGNVYMKPSFAAQDVSIYEGGSKTGEIPVTAIKDIGVTKVIIGHSECRERGDTLDMVVIKVRRALDAQMDIILCIGEKERDTGVAYLKVIDEQITSVFDTIDVSEYNRITLAYEPVWAINNKENISLDAHGLHSMVVYIRKLFIERYGHKSDNPLRILYGGSVTPENTQDLFWNGEVDGLLIGRASFDPETLSKVVANVLINPKKNILKTYGIHKKNS